MINLELIRSALAEDLEGGEDLTSVSTISAESVSTADFTARKAGVLAGIDMVR
jgi:nicotinate-nucleotide pyrophosphorylase (carboxylating)